MNTICIRPAVGKDLAQLEQVELEAMALFSRGDLPRHLAQPVPRAALESGLSSSTLWVAAQGENILGFTLCAVVDTSLHIVETDVRLTHGRQGTGAAMLHHAFGAARALGVGHITLTTFEHLPWNAPFYKKHGFACVGDFTPFPHLVAALRQEVSRGLERRIAMAKNAIPSVEALTDNQPRSMN